MGLFSRKKEYILNRQCLCGQPYRIVYLHQSGKPPEITYPKPRQCPKCGRYRNDVGRKRGYFDGRYERD